MRRLFLAALLALLPSLAGAQAVIVPSAVPALTNGCTLMWQTGTSTWVCAAPGAASQPLTDSVGLIADDADSSKILAFQLSGLTTSTTRTWTIPDANITVPSTIASLAANTFTGLQTANGGIATTTLSASSTISSAVSVALTGTTNNLGTITTGTWNAGAVTSSGGISGTTGAFSSRVSVGSATSSATALRVAGDITSGTTQYGVAWDGTISGTTASAMFVSGGTLKASTAITDLYGLIIYDPDLGGGATVTNQYGVYVNALTRGGTLKYAIYTAGTTPSYFGGNTTLGGNLNVASLKYIYLDGGGDTAIQESSANVITFYSAGDVAASISSTATTLAGTLTVNGFGTHTFSAGGTGGNQLDVVNTTGGTGNYAAVRVSDAATYSLYLRGNSGSFTPSGIHTASGASIYNDGPGGLSIAATHASGAIRFYSGGTTQTVVMGPNGMGLNTRDSESCTLELYAANASGKNVVINLIAAGSNSSTIYYSRDDARTYVVGGGSGGVYLANTGTSWSAVSDERLKTDLRPITNAARKLAGVRTVTGRLLTDAPGASRAFLLAQDFQVALPEAVTVGLDGTLGLSYTDTIPLIIAGWQDHNARIAALEAELAALKAQKEIR